MDHLSVMQGYVTPKPPASSSSFSQPETMTSLLSFRGTRKEYFPGIYVNHTNSTID